MQTSPHELSIRVRYAEADSMGVVHHASYLIYLEEGRTELMRSIGVPYEEVEASGVAMGVRKIDVRYRLPAKYGDEIRVRTHVDRIRGASIRFAYELLRAADDAVLLTGTVETVCLDMASLRPTPTPETIRRAVEGCGAGPGAG